MHYVFAAHGTWGDVGPMADVAALLHQRGARVTFISTPFFEQGLRGRGLTTRIVGEFWDPGAALADPRLSHPLTGPVDIWRLIFGPLVPLMFDATVAALGDDPGSVVLHPWCLGAQLAAESRAVPWSVVALAPITWFSVADVPVTAPFELPGWLARGLMKGPTHFVVRTIFGRTLHDEARRRGLPRRDDRFFLAMHEARHNLAFWPESFRAPAADDPPRAVLCGFPQPAHRAARLDEGLERFLGEGDAPLVMGMGSALPGLAQDMYDVVAEAARGLGLRVVLVGAEAKETPPDVQRVAHAPYSALFSRARVVVHHGGIGTTAEGLAAARPQLVIPFGADQYDNAARLGRLGVARHVVRRKFQRARVKAALEDLLSREADVRAKAEALGLPLRTARPGVEVAAEALGGSS